VHSRTVLYVRDEDEKIPSAILMGILHSRRWGSWNPPRNLCEAGSAFLGAVDEHRQRTALSASCCWALPQQVVCARQGVEALEDGAIERTARVVRLAADAIADVALRGMTC
jgi:hypothetical protein